MKSSRIGKTAILAAAIILTASLSVGSALAYFTTYCRAQGAVAMDMGFTDTEIEEKVDEKGKHITVLNIGEYDCFVRVKVFAPDFANLNFEESDGWEYDKSDGYWYYTPVLTAQGETTELLAKYEFPEAPGEGEEDTRPDEFNIVVVYEYTPVLYDEDGAPYADWNNRVSLNDTEQEGE